MLTSFWYKFHTKKNHFTFVTKQFCNGFNAKVKTLITNNNYSNFAGVCEDDHDNHYENLYQIKSTFLILMIYCIDQPLETRKLIYEQLKKIKNNNMQILKNMEANRIPSYIVDKLKKCVPCITSKTQSIISDVQKMKTYENEHDNSIAFYLPKNLNLDLYRSDDGVLCIPFKHIYKAFCKKELEIVTGNETAPNAEKITNIVKFSQITSKKMCETIGNLKIRITAGISTIFGAISFGIGIAFLPFPGLNFLSPFLMAGGGVLMTGGAVAFAYDEYKLNKNNNLNNNQNSLITPLINPNDDRNSLIGQFPGAIQRSMTANLLQQQQANQQPRRRVGGEQLH